jgi:hypothetical protein
MALPSHIAPAPLPSWPHRIARHVVPVLFLLAVTTAAISVVPAFNTKTALFSHRYPPVPSSAGRLAVGAPVLPVPPTNLILGVSITSLPLLAQALPAGALTGSGANWTLHQPVLVANGGSLSLTGPATLALAPGSYVEVGPGGTGSLSSMTLSGGKPTSNRGFLLDVAGTLRLTNDHLDGLVVLADNVTGTLVRDVRAGAAVRHGIVLYDGASADALVRDRVWSTFDGIVLDYAGRNHVEHTTVTGARRFCLRITGTSRHNLVTHNAFTGCAVGAYLAQGATANTLTANRMSGNGENVRVRVSAPDNVVTPIPPHSELASV